VSADLHARNRRVLAARCGWPAGVLETCVRLEAEHPDWRVGWLDANPITGWERPAGYCATRDDVSLPRGDELRRLPEDGVARHPHVFGATPAALRERIAAMQQRIDREARRRELLWRSLVDR
jgi:hypothetical protein